MEEHRDCPNANLKQSIFGLTALTLMSVGCGGAVMPSGAASDGDSVRSCHPNHPNDSCRDGGVGGTGGTVGTGGTGGSDGSAGSDGDVTTSALDLAVYWVEAPSGPAPSAELWDTVARHYTSLDDLDEEPVFWAAGHFPNQHWKFRQPASLAGVQSDATNPGPATAVIYDCEHWSATPTSEQDNLVASIAQAADIARQSGLASGTAPDRSYLESLYTQIDWTKEDWLIMQLQRLSDQTQQLVNDVQTIAGRAKAMNPNIKVAVHLALRFAGSLSQLQTDIRALKQMSPRPFDSIAIVYHTDTAVCPDTLCNASNLDAALSTIR